MINVTKTFLPPVEDYMGYIHKIFASGQVTNQGACVEELERKLQKYCGVEHLQYVSNGTVAIQLALRALDLQGGDIITTPFSYVATLTSILWEGFNPIFVDIDEKTLCIDHTQIEKAITKDTKAILAVHVFGYPCEVEAIQEIAGRHNLKVLYDGAHAFSVKYNDKHLLAYGDMSTCSFHATKIFHTIEGGCIITRDTSIDNKINYIKRFGHIYDDYKYIGINAKNSEMHAAMGLCNINHVDEIIKVRKRISEQYDSFFDQKLKRPICNKKIEYNYAYYPVIFDSEEQLLAVCAALKTEEIIPRRYFYPSLNLMPYIKPEVACSISEDISRRILCLPLFVGLGEKDVETIARIILAAS